MPCETSYRVSILVDPPSGANITPPVNVVTSFQFVGTPISNLPGTLYALKSDDGGGTTGSRLRVGRESVETTLPELTRPAPDLIPFKNISRDAISPKHCSQEM